MIKSEKIETLLSKIIQLDLPTDFQLLIADLNDMLLIAMHNNEHT